ncbi:MAG TPA: RNA polymerase sigma factor [Acidimicrobiales bacterium]|nr:RNA polymerase sigma factor [Acidimicrobiales bacterium]
MIRDADLPDVVAAAGKGEHWALTELFRAYQPPLLRFLRAQEPRVADDLAGEVWIAVARGLDQFDGDEAGFRGWLFTIARRRLIDHRRRTVRQRTDVVASETLDTADEWGLGGDPAGEVLERLTAQGAVETLVAELTPDQAEAVLLRVVGGLSVAETARIMDREPGTVRVLCHRALRRLAAHFGEDAVTR